MKTETLARALSTLADGYATIESKADSVLAIIRTKGIRNETEFKTAAKAAYVENGWNTVAGRPSADSKLKAVPITVKQYVSRVRAAFRAKLPVMKFKTFHELRKALANLKPAAVIEVNPVFKGLRLIQPSESNGATIHDLAVLCGSIAAAKRRQLLQEVTVLMGKYAPAEEMKKAA